MNCPNCNSGKNQEPSRRIAGLVHCPYCDSEYKGPITAVSPTSDRALAMSQRALKILEDQAAGYTSLSMPVHLKIALEDKRAEVAAMLAERR